MQLLRCLLFIEAYFHFTLTVVVHIPGVHNAWQMICPGTDYPHLGKESMGVFFIRQSYLNFYCVAAKPSNGLDLTSLDGTFFFFSIL